MTKYYRIGRKQNRALLNDKGKLVALFEVGQEETAGKVCKMLNEEIGRSESKYSEEDPDALNFKGFQSLTWGLFYVFIILGIITLTIYLITLFY